MAFIWAFHLQTAWADDLVAVLETLGQTTPLPPESAPKFGTFYTFQHASNWPPLPADVMNLPFWDLGGGFLILDDRTVDYAALRAEAEINAAEEEGMMFQNSMMSMRRAYNSYGGQVYLADVAATLSGNQMTASFSIAGGTNYVPYDIWMTTNLLNKISLSQWTWFGVGYTSNRYTFTNQPFDRAFYALARPQKTMVVAWGNNSDAQCDVPFGLSNAVTVAGGYGQSLALLNDGTVRAWGNDPSTGCVGQSIQRSRRFE
jgi:hypothetical protein